MDDELRPNGPGHYRINLVSPWGQAIPADLIVTTRRGWSRRPESRDPRWAAFPVGPALLAIRLRGARVAREPLLLDWAVPAEWN